MAREISAVLEYGAPDPGETATMMEDKLRFHTDSWDLSVDLRAGLSDIVVIDARSRDAYAAGHIPGAVSFPHREMVPRPLHSSTAAKSMSSIATGSVAMHRPRARTSSLGSDFALRNYSAGSIGGAATGTRWPLRTSPAVYLQQNSGQSQRIGTRGAPSVPLRSALICSRVDEPKG
jgi:rhodanese-related sulfurtransferase